MRRSLAIFAITMFATGPSLAAPVTKTFSNAWTTKNGEQVDIVASITPYEDLADLDGSKNQIGIGSGWFHKSVWDGNAEITYEFVDASGNSITLPTFSVEISDIDAGNGNGFSQEIFQTQDVDGVSTLPGGLIKTEIVDSAQGKFQITSRGNTNGSLSNSVILGFSNKSSFTLEYRAVGGWKHANYWNTNGGGISLIDATADQYSGFSQSARTASIPAPAVSWLLISSLGILFAGVMWQQARE